ncbi:MAG: DUF4388 domain-containing protein, partial [Candidatus Aminicenantes bacterium]|nr:DUF4388 domain-containing protein [Candidatus Aminicenantes bacterium]
PFSFLLFDLWNSRKNGKLSIKNAEVEKTFFFEEGSIVITSETFNEKTFFSDLTDKEIIETSSLKNILAHAEKEHMSLIKTCLLMNILTTPYLWKLMQEYSLSSIIPLFDMDDSEFVFHPDNNPDKLKIWCRLQTLAVILQGTRQMTNSDFIASQLPENDGDAQILHPQHQSRIPFYPEEEYLLHLFSNLQNLKSVYKYTEMNTRDTQRIVFTFLSLGLFSFSKIKKQNHSLPDFSNAELHTILSAFNRKWLFVYKYISKELGPVAQNILEKSLEDAKARLSPLFQSVKLQPDGSIDTNSVLKAKFNFSSQGTKQTLLIGLNEIIVSEVMAVKKTLGDEHEAILIQNLQKIKK